MHFAHHNRQERREQQRDVSNDFISINQVNTASFFLSLFVLINTTVWLFAGLSRQGSLALFVQLMPILILIIVSALSQLMVTQPPYSLSYRQWVSGSLSISLMCRRAPFTLSSLFFCLISPYIRSAGHIHKRHTSHLNVPFYVGDRFNEEYSGNNLKNVERSVEEDYISNLRNNCWKEKQQSEFALLRSFLLCSWLD